MTFRSEERRVILPLTVLKREKNRSKKCICRKRQRWCCSFFVRSGFQGGSGWIPVYALKKRKEQKHILEDQQNIAWSNGQSLKKQTDGGEKCFYCNVFCLLWKALKACTQTSNQNVSCIFQQQPQKELNSYTAAMIKPAI